MRCTYIDVIEDLHDDARVTMDNDYVASNKLDNFIKKVHISFNMHVPFRTNFPVHFSYVLLHFSTNSLLL